MSIKIKNLNHEIDPLSVGHETPTRIIVNLGITPEFTNTKAEIQKAIVALDNQADMLSDVSLGKNYKIFLKKLLEISSVPVSTVPLYGIVSNSLTKRGAFYKFTMEDLLTEVLTQAEMGVDIMTFHAALTLNVLEEVKKSSRIIKLPSRGGTLIAAHMIYNKIENTLYQVFDEILNILTERSLKYGHKNENLVSLVL